MKDRDVQTIQQTSKKWKALQLLGFLTVVAGGTSLAMLKDAAWFHPGAGALLMIAGFALFGVGALLAWWHHG